MSCASREDGNQFSSSSFWHSIATLHATISKEKGTISDQVEICCKYLSKLPGLVNKGCGFVHELPTLSCDCSAHTSALAEVEITCGTICLVLLVCVCVVGGGGGGGECVCVVCVCVRA